MYYSPNRGNIGNISLNVANYYITLFTPSELNPPKE
ncbi:hypothetical protein SAMN06265364_11825 [Prevotella jejuni]|uniref:Uncharacterized protein n=1 Tax=Prevotella jejuni TaxID=1177574 RepID=A0AA94IUY3_9BACT|nr:hypothetical protein SAMN06265364_11825 [Prevotella jejuni]